MPDSNINPGANSLSIMADIRTPVKGANAQLMNESTPRPRTVFQRRTQSAMSHSGIKISSRFKSRARGGNTSDVMGEDNSTGFSIQSTTFHANIGSTSNLDFESDEEFKREHDSQKLARQSKKKSPTPCPQTNTMNDQSSAKCNRSVINTASSLPDQLSVSSVATKLRRSSSTSSVQSFRTTPENISELELMSAIEAEKEQHADTAAKLREVRLEFDNTKKTLKISLEYSSQLEEANKTISKEVDTLRKKLETAEAQYHKEQDMLENRIVTLRDNLETSATTFAEKQETGSKKTASLKSQLQEATEGRNSAIAETSIVAEENATLLGSIDNLRMQLKEAEEATSSISAQNHRLGEEKEHLTEEIDCIKSELKQTYEARDSAHQKVSSLKDTLLVNYSADLEGLLDQLKTLTTTAHPPVSVAERKHLLDHIQDLKDARDTEVQLISHLFKERNDLTEKVAKLQAEIKLVVESRDATQSQIIVCREEAEISSKENAVLQAQVDKLKEFLDFAQKRVSRLEEDKKSGAHEMLQVITKIEDLQVTLQLQKEHTADSTATRQLTQGNLLLQQAENKASGVQEKLAAHQSCDTKLTCAESSLRNVKSQLEKEKSGHKLCKEKLEGLLQRDAAVRTSTASRAINLQASLEREQSEHQVCKTRLTRTADELQLSLAANEASLGKISRLESQIGLQKPLFQIGLLARQMWWELARDQNLPGGQSCPYRNRGIKNRALINNAEAKMKKPDFAADTSLFLLGTLTSTKDSGMFMSIYGQTVPRSIYQAAHPALLAELANMRAALRERRRLSASEYGAWFANSKSYNKLENECKVAFVRMMQEAGLSIADCSGHERSIVGNAFDNDPDVQSKVSTMKQIFNKEMNKFHNTTRNQ